MYYLSGTKAGVQTSGTGTGAGGAAACSSGGNNSSKSESLFTITWLRVLDGVGGAAAAEAPESVPSALALRFRRLVAAAGMAEVAIERAGLVFSVRKGLELRRDRGVVAAGTEAPDSLSNDGARCSGVGAAASMMGAVGKTEARSSLTGGAGAARLASKEAVAEADDAGAGAAALLLCRFVRLYASCKSEGAAVGGSSSAFSSRVSAAASCRFFICQDKIRTDSYQGRARKPRKSKQTDDARKTKIIRTTFVHCVRPVVQIWRFRGSISSSFLVVQPSPAAP
jgi:hypothetical protein